MKKSEADPAPRLPVKLDATTNGEYFPAPVPPRLAALTEQALRTSLENAERVGLSRRDYLRSTCASATVLLALNQLGCAGGRYNVPREAALQPAAAEQVLSGKEFIFDVQTHQVSATRPWWEVQQPNLGDFLGRNPQGRCGASHWSRCFTDDVLIREVFLDSDTDLAVLSALWGSPLPMEAEEAARTREKVAMLEGRKRLRIHGTVQPNGAPFEQVAQTMRSLAEDWRIDAWKLYPVWGPEGRGYFLDDELGTRTIQQGLEAGIPLFAIHKGLPLGGMDARFSNPRDVGPVARAFPRATFLIYHSGYEAGWKEGPYDPTSGRGVDALLKSLQDHGVGKDGNVYAELGSTWREVMKDPDQAAHLLGKLLLHLGEDRILWGTDSIWYGSPQDQIEAFRAFEITPEFQERFGYPALTPERKAKIFGLSAARVYGVDVDEMRRVQRSDIVSRVRAEYADDPRPSHQTYGPRTRREMLSLLRATQGRPD